MAQLDLVKLASQGRAFSATRPWSEDELQALLALERECELERGVAAEYVRNGILTVEDYQKAEKASFTPKTLEEIQTEAVEKNLESVQKTLNKTKVKKKATKDK